MNYEEILKTLRDIDQTIEALEDMVESVEFAMGNISEDSALDAFIKAQENMYEKWIDLKALKAF